MGDKETVKIRHKHGEGDASSHYAIINKDDYDPKKHKLLKGGEDDAEHHAESLDDRGKNPSGTFSTPTPTDVRYADKDGTEFENNRGAFVGRSAAGIREEKGLPDEPGGILGSVEIPEDWKDLSIGEKRALVQQLGGKENMKPSEANKFIRDELARREGGDENDE